MSFLVSFNGQFSPYKLPDLSHYDRIRKIYKSQTMGSEFDSHLSEKIEQKQGSKSKNLAKASLSKYQKIQKSFETQKIPLHARELMTSNIYCFSPTKQVSEALDYIKENQIHHLPIINENNILVGLVSDRDLLKASPNEFISNIMTKEVIACLDNTRIQDIAKIMLHENINSIPIINNDYNLLGILTTRDILHFMTRIAHLQELA